MFSNPKKSRAAERLVCEKKQVRFNVLKPQAEKSGTFVREPSFSSKSLGISLQSKSTLFYDPVKPTPSNYNNRKVQFGVSNKEKGRRKAPIQDIHQMPATVISSTELSEIHKLARGYHPNPNNYNQPPSVLKIQTTNNLISQQPVPFHSNSTQMFDRPMTLLERKRLQWEKEREEINSLGTPWGYPMPSSSKSMSTQNLSSWPHSDSKIGPTPIIVSSDFMGPITNTGSDCHLPKIGLQEHISKPSKYDFWSSSGDLKRYHRKLSGVSAEEEIFTSGYQSEVGNAGWQSSGHSSRNGSGDHAGQPIIMTDIHQSQGSRRHTIADVNPRNGQGIETMTSTTTTALPPAAMRSSFTSSLEAADQDAYKDLKRREQQEWLRDLDRQRQDQANRKKMEKEAESGVCNGRWGDRGVVVGQMWEPISSVNAHPSQPTYSTSTDYLNGNHSPRWAQSQGFNQDYIVNSVSSPSLLNLNPTPNYVQTETEQKTFIRGQNVPVDPDMFAQRERKRLLALQHQEDIRKQIEERQEKLRAEKAKRLQEEAEYEARFRAQALAERMQMEKEKYNSTTNTELPVTAISTSLPTETQQWMGQTEQRLQKESPTHELSHFASTRKNIESSMSSLSPDIPNPSYTSMIGKVCDSYTQTEDGKEYVYMAPTPVENILAEVELEENSAKPKVKVVKTMSKKAPEIDEEYQENELEESPDKTISKRKERPQWGVPPKTKVYLKQSEKDPYYQQRLKKRKERMKKREEEILRSKQIPQSKLNLKKLNRSQAPKCIPAYESDSETEVLQPIRRNIALGSGLDLRRGSSLHHQDDNFKTKEQPKKIVKGTPNRKRIAEPEYHKPVNKDLLFIRSQSPESRFRGTSPPVPALMKKMEEGVDPEDFGAAIINYDYDGLGVSNERAPILSPPVPALLHKMEETRISKAPTPVPLEFVPSADEKSPEVEVYSSGSSVDLNLSLGEIPIETRKGSSISKISSSTRTIDTSKPELPQRMILKDDNTQLDPRAESPLRRLLHSLQTFSIQGGTTSAGGEEARVTTRSMDPEQYSYRSNLSEARGATTDMSARENLISFIMNQEDDEEFSSLQVGVSPRDNEQDGILQFKIKVPKELNTNVQQLSKLGLTKEIVGTQDLDRREEPSSVKPTATQEYQDPLSIEKRRTLDWLYGRKGSGSSQSSLLSHLSSLKRGIKHQEEEWGIIASDTEISQVSSYYPYSSN